MRPSTGWIACSGRATQSRITLIGDRDIPARLASGSLVLEITVPRGPYGARPILHSASRETGGRMVSLHLTLDGRLVLTQIDGDNRLSLTLDTADGVINGGLLRVIYRWSPTQSLLTLESPDAGLIRQRVGPGAPPMTRAGIITLMNPPAQGPGMEWIAIGDHAQPVGPAACFAPSTPILTPCGNRPAAQIKAGDLVETVDFGPQEVLWSGRVDWPALGSFAPVRLNAPAFGQTRDLWLLASHRIVASGPSIEYHIGRDALLVEARHLIDGCSANHAQAPRVLGWHGILLRKHHLLIADGCQVESLYTGGLGVAPDVIKTTALAQVSGQLPTQHPIILRDLTRAQVMTLVSARAQRRSPIAA